MYFCELLVMLSTSSNIISTSFKAKCADLDLKNGLTKMSTLSEITQCNE